MLFLSLLNPLSHSSLDTKHQLITAKICKIQHHSGSRRSWTLPLSQLSFQSSVRPTQPGPSVYNCHTGHDGGLNGSAKAPQACFKWVTDGKVEVGVGGLPRPGQPATCSAASEGWHSHAQRTPRSPRKSCRDEETDWQFIFKNRDETLGWYVNLRVGVGWNDELSSHYILQFLFTNKDHLLPFFMLK